MTGRHPGGWVCARTQASWHAQCPRTRVQAAVPPPLRPHPAPSRSGPPLLQKPSRQRLGVSLHHLAFGHVGLAHNHLSQRPGQNSTILLFSRI